MQHFQFHPLQLATPRRFGISAMLRVKNGAEFLEATIRSHLPYFDEIVVCYNDCTDHSEQILRRLLLEFPAQLRLFHYEPTVHPILSQGHRQTGTFSIHSMANYYNYTLAQCRYQIVVKLDDDHLAIAQNMQKAVATVRQAYLQGRPALFRFSGLNLAGDRAAPKVYQNCPLVGTGDILFFPLDPQIYFVQARQFETLQFGRMRQQLPKRYLGLLYCHLKHLKADYGFANLAEPARSQHIRHYQQHARQLSLAEFCHPANQQQLKRQYGRCSYWLRQQALIGFGLRLLGKVQPLRFARLAQLAEDLQGLDWQQDVMRWLAAPAMPAALPADLAATAQTAGHSSPLLQRFG